MATVNIPAENRTITSADEISAFLKPFGIWYEHWQVAGRLDPAASDADILTEYAPEIQKVKTAGGFVTADVINVNPSTPNLDAMLATLRSELSSLDRVVRIVKTLGLVRCTNDFGQSPLVINGFSQVFADLFGTDRGIGARSALGTNALPNGMAVEVEAVFEIKP